MTSDLGSWLAEVYLGGPARGNLDLHVDRSPVLAADRVHTPILLYHGRSDPRVPVSQTLEYRNALTAMGGDAEALLLPGEKHDMIRRIGLGTGAPSHQLAIRQATLDWFERYLGSAHVNA